VLRYTMSDKKTVCEGQKLVSGINCTPQSAYTEFNNTKLLYGKDGGRMYYHFTESFPVGEDITPQTAHEIALKFAQEAEMFKGFEVVVSTHCDRDHIHSHFVMNSVNADDGHKFHVSQRDVEHLMKVSDSIIEPYGLSICVPDKSKKVKKSVSNSEYYALKSKESWKLQLALTIDDCMGIAKSKKHFKWLMEQEGYKVKWTDERKYITYTTPDGKLCRDIKLHEEKYLKGNMENEFRIRQRILYGFQESSNQSIENGGQSRADGYSNRDELESGNRFTENDNRLDGVHFRETGNADDQAGFGFKDARSDSFPQGGVFRTVTESDCYFRIDENGSVEYIETGWEPERSELLTSGITAEKDDRFYKKAISDFADSGGIIADALYLTADISNLIDEDGEIQDCTTIHYPAERKKKQEQGYGGPVMGGM
jgi:hypothetical protein